MGEPIILVETLVLPLWCEMQPDPGPLILALFSVNASQMKQTLPMRRRARRR